MVHPNIDAFLARLKRVSKTKSGWEACCPAHNDTDPSLSVSIGTSGGIVVCCHARQCTAESIAQAVGMQLLDFAPEPPRSGSGPELTYDQRVVTAYDYRDASGVLIYQAVRLHSPKDFRQRRVTGARLGPDNTREPVFAWNMRGQIRVPYRLPELLAGDGWIIVAEGEKDADALAGRGLNATTNAGGAGKWSSLDAATLDRTFRGRRVAILPDNDAPGLRHAVDVADDLRGRGAACVKVVLLPGLKPKGDVSDWFAVGGQPDTLMAMIQLAPDWPAMKPELVAAAAELDRQRDAAKVAAATPKDEPEIHLTDVGNSIRFSRQHRDRARYCQSWGTWLIWTGSHWQIDSRNAAVTLAKSTVRSILAEARGQLGTADAVLQQQERSTEATSDRQAQVVASATTSAKALSLHAFRSESAPRIAALLKLAQSDLPVVPEDLDRDVYLFNCLNGTLNLRTGEFRDHSRDDNLTRVAPVHYDPEAKCPEWERTLRSIFPEDPLSESCEGDGEMIAFVRRFFGLCLTGDTTAQALTILHGEGSNGKSTLLETVCSVLGPYAGPSPKGLLEVRRGEQHPTELAKLFGKRLVHATETSEGARLDETQVKSLTGGDTILARRMREDFWEFSPTHKLVICTNHKPKIKGTDYAIWRRVLLVPFRSRFWNPDEPEKAGERRLERFRKRPELIGGKFRDEWPGILNWLVQGFHDWRRGGLRPPERVQVATADYRRQEDLVGQFIEERCELWPSNSEIKTTSGNLYTEFRKWCENSGERTVSHRLFVQRVVAATGLEPVKSHGRWLPGICLIDDGSGADGAHRSRESRGSNDYDDVLSELDK